MVESVQDGLAPMRADWSNIADAVDPELLDVMFSWAWTQIELQSAVREAFGLAFDAPIDNVRPTVRNLVESWLAGDRFEVMARRSAMNVDDMLRIHTKVVTFGLQTLVEQALAQLERVLVTEGRELAAAASQFSEHLRFDVPTSGARTFSAVGLRHRSAAVALGSDGLFRAGGIADRARLRAEGRRLLIDDAALWRERMGLLVYQNTLQDLS